MRIAMRSLEKGEALREYFQEHGEKIELIQVEDFTKVCEDSGLFLRLNEVWTRSDESISRKEHSIRLSKG